MNTQRFLSLIILLTMFVGIQSCNDETELNLNLTEVKTLYTPVDDLSVLLKPHRNLSEVFQWDRARAEDGSLVIYEVLFDEENGDFSSPLYSMMSDGRGVESKITISHSDLNKVAQLGGAAFFEKKKFKWTVAASKGSNTKLATESRTIELERPGGFTVIPSTVYLTGTATEGGSDITNALEMKQTDPGKFEIYTKLSPGTYKFTDGLGGSARTFFITDDEGVKILGIDDENTYDGDAKPYRIRLDFNSTGVTVEEVKSVQLFYSPNDEFWATLQYTADGVWRANNYTVNLRVESWGMDERHKYKVVLNNGVADREEWWGYVGNDSPSQDGTYGNANPTYSHAFLIANNDRWNNAWKWDRPAVQGKQVDFILSFNATSPYKMDYIVH